MKASPQSICHKKKRVCVCVCDCTVGSLTSLLCVFMFVSLCNYAHSSAHSSDSCRFCQVDIQELAINNSARFVWPARSSARWWEGHLNLTRGVGLGGWGCVGGGRRSRRVWAPVCTIWQGVRRGCIIGGGDHLQKTVKVFNLDALVSQLHDSTLRLLSRFFNLENFQKLARDSKPGKKTAWAQRTN